MFEKIALTFKTFNIPSMYSVGSLNLDTFPLGQSISKRDRHSIPLYDMSSMAVLGEMGYIFKSENDNTSWVSSVVMQGVESVS